MIYFYIILAFIMMQRLVELYIANKNEQWMRERGGIEIGSEHYKLFIFLHILFFIFLIIEVTTLYIGSELTFNFYFFLMFFLAQVGRVWCILSLGKFWNTKIIVLPKVILIKKGPYKYIKHPNYVIVFIELFVIPAMFGAYVTAFLFPVLHLLLLTIRIPSEERALGRRV
ncbi:isoprenylcysteine carboxyl methyltransferase family protein [Pseudogracilibacillus auburnensis]|uniref:15-methylpalmitoyl-4-hydroxy-2-pyrone 4-O-methyltransferase n=1 Tax=Pseudogracilibacillus auburnensis TaxID=1494959 RepID=A0A2V3W8X4_9BACI|nr:isoprenylcysteine carboxylmethyltransferase family protein [Pseudogracilibacillus auburnensis]MBO1004617.1 hypothetical protein [Pseudogracilibacillus auburnensis]PXW85169.1 15-methylpalmitoyl-4-hydroxy-2-pyrone 4-O-methyltransferase [Pseudogracilibacillus auburnensis]